MEHLINKFCKHTLKVGPKTSNVAARCELGKAPISTSIISNFISFQQRMRTQNPDSLIYKAYETQKDLITTNKSFIARCKHVLDQLGRYNTTLPPITSNSNSKQLKHFKRKLKSCLQNQYASMCIKEIDNSPKLRFYKNIKRNFNLEPYIIHPINSKYQRAMTKLRLSNHKLPIETGRHQQKQIEDRICTICNLKEVGDELHILGHCANKNLQIARDTFLSEVLVICPQLNHLNNDNIWIYLMNNRDVSIMRHVCKYVYECLELYKEESKQ